MIESQETNHNAISVCVELFVHSVSKFLLIWIVLPVLYSLVIFLLAYVWFNNLHVTKCANKLPQIRVWPLLTYWKVLARLYGNPQMAPALCYIFQAFCGVSEIFRKEKLANVWVSIRPVALFFHPQTVEIVLNNSASLEKSREYKFLHAWLGTGLLTSGGEKWKSRRRLLTPAFHFRILEDFMPVFNEQSTVLVNKLKKSADLECVDMRHLVALCTLDIICETAMGVRIKAQHNEDSEYVRTIYEIGNAFFYRIPQPWLWIDWMFYLFPSGRRFLKNLKTVHSFTRRVIQDKKKALMKANRGKLLECQPLTTHGDRKTRPRRAFLELLVEHHLEDSSFTEEDIREEVDTFMFEGHDTTASAITWTLYNIGLRSDVQENIFKELDDIFGADTDRPITIEDLKSMKYLECVLKESLRLYPPVPFIAREVHQDLDVLGYTISPGSLCLIFPFMVHRDPEIYKNPEVFDPERFLPENCSGRHPYAYIPFSAGPRNCIGQRFAVMEEKTVIANILRNFKVSSLDPRDRVIITIDLVLRSDKPLKMKLTPR